VNKPWPWGSTGHTSIFSVTFSSGIFNSPVKDLGADVNRYSYFRTNHTLNGGVIDYYVRSGNSVADIESSNWVSQPQGSTSSVTSNRYFQWRAIFQITRSSQNPFLQDVSQEWLDNRAKQKVASWVFDDRYWLAHTTSTTFKENDTVLVIDKANQPTIFRGINALSFAEAFGNKYFGTSKDTGTGAGYVSIFNNSFNDAGTAYGAYFTTPDLCIGGCMTDKVFNKIWVKTRNDGSSGGTLSTVFQFNNDGVFTSLGDISLTEQTGLILSKVFFPMGSGGTVGKTISLTFSNGQASHDFRFYGAKLFYETYPTE